MQGDSRRADVPTIYWTELEAACFRITSTTSRGTCSQACDTWNEVQLFLFYNPSHNNYSPTKSGAVVHGARLQLPGCGVEW